jgi:hypothetical protein
LILPHTFPFRLVDQRAGRARLSLSSNALFVRGSSAPGLSLLVEAAAQAAAIQLGGGAQSAEQLRLAALSEVVLTRQPSLGSLLTFELAVEGRFGGLTRISALVLDEASVIARMKLVLTEAAAPA